MKKITIAVDGFSSCGKSTMAKDLAREIGYIYIDSGAMYRATTLFALQNNIFDSNNEIDTSLLKELLPSMIISFKLNPETKTPETYLNNQLVEKEIRSMEVSQRVSPIAAIDFVREEMVKQQQAMGKNKGIVMDGRDIGTTVFPNAELKIFVTATPQVRAQRRYDEMIAKTGKADFNEILKNIEERDYIDQNRKVSPLKQADDALVLDNSSLTIAEQKEWLLQQFARVASQS
ncbi:Cytidylate kinase [Bacteroides coprosuis DSM 18011]|uniref:Cytidylate kinase n=1 Tax=Bacteroides coprosuis DSM 18011 TaxID=679937 RepID=F3ZP69_9BACE|nr:(d)CMP kinase [Bacteroides coprosuis]EGJ70296.1 Cytidylate kinase [Bacteroides coprosuis DSM 18011]HJD93319.1 (d)CMP kinase [Bacteroides coprosuis]